MKNNDISPKVGAAAVGGAVSTIGLYIGQQLGWNPGTDVGAAIALLVSTGLAYWARDKHRDTGTGNGQDDAA